MPTRTPFLVVLTPPGQPTAPCLAALEPLGLPIRWTDCPAQALHLAADAAVVLVEGWRPVAAELCERLRADPATADVPILLFDDSVSVEPPGFGEPDVCLPCSTPGNIVRAQVRLLLRLRRAEQACRASETRMQVILDRAPVAVSVKDEHGRFVLVNRCWEGHFHLRRDQVLGRTPHEVFDPTEAHRHAERCRAVLDSADPLEFEDVCLQADGPHTYLETNFTLQTNGEPFAVCGIATDITARKRAEEALRDSEALYHSLVETLPVCIFRKDLAGRFTFVNSAFCRELGRPASEILGRCDGDFFPADLACKYIRDDQRVIATRQVFETVEEHVSASGEKRVVEVIKSVVVDAAGRVVGMQGVFWDVTDRCAAERELARTTADIHVARRVQQYLFPAPASPVVCDAARLGFDIGGTSHPVEPVGGDYYDFFPLDDRWLAVAIGDVSGHGVGPALLMAMARAYLRASARPGASPADVLVHVNRLLTQDMEGDRYLTLLFACIDLETRSLVYASAGHVTGYVLGSRDEIKFCLNSTGVPLGICASEIFPNSAPIPLVEGDIIVLLTDGVFETLDPHRCLFDPDRVLDLVRVYRRTSARQIASNLYHAVRAFAQNHPQLDDVTAVVIKVVPPLALPTA